MAERRMFTKKITDDDHFSSLSSPAQALYLHLSMCADDDGFCNQVYTCMFKSHASVSDLESLLEKRYIYQFENGVIVIKHWRMANALRKDRYTPTTFKKEMDMLKLDENGAYTMNFSASDDTCCQTVAKRLPQERIDKVSKEEESIEKEKGTNVPKKKTVYFPQNEELENAFQEFLTMRKNIKKPISTKQAITRMLNKIEKLSGGDDDLAIKIINQSTDHCWQDVYALKENSGSSPKTVFDEWRDA